MTEANSLIRRILEGDTNSFRILMQENQRLVCHIVFRMIREKSDREDLCQEVFLKVYQNLASFQFGSKLSSWIAKIAYHSCIDFLKKSKKYTQKHISLEDTFPQELAETGNSPDESMQKEEVHLSLQKEIEKLPPHYRAILTLFHLEEKSYAEISQIMQLPEGTVKSYLFRARKVLRKKLAWKYERKEI